MSATISSRAWLAERSGEASEAAAGEWLMRRHCSLAPRPLIAALGIAALLPLVIASVFFGLGATLVMPFAWLEIAALATALVVYARHTGDCERVRIEGGRVQVERTFGTRVERIDFDAAWLRVDLQPGGQRLVELSGQGRRVLVGRLIRPQLRPQLARDLRFALLRQRAGV